MGRNEDEGMSRDGDARPAGDQPLSEADLRVPDDARALTADLLALRRERRAQARQERLRRMFGAGWWRSRVAGPLLILVLVLVIAATSLAVLFLPRRSAVRPAPLATSGVRDVGREGGLLPDVSVRRSDGVAVRLRDLRPAMVALPPPGCGCDAALRQAGLAALRHDVDYLLVGATVPPQPAGLPARAATRVAEPGGALADVYRLDEQRPAVPVLLLIRGDGVVNRILTRPAVPSALDGELAVLAATAAGAR